MGEKLDFFSPLGFEAKTDYDHKTSKLKPHSVRGSERYLNHKNPIHDRETASILRFSAETVESDFCLEGKGKTTRRFWHYELSLPVVEALH